MVKTENFELTKNMKTFIEKEQADNVSNLIPIIENMHVDFFSGTFYAMRTKYKKKYCLLKDEVAEYFFESLFILSI